MQLVLCTNPRNAGAWLLRFVMWSRWSHSALLDGDTVYDATFWGGGVRATPAGDFFRHYTQSELLTIDIVPSLLPAARAWLSQQLGKPYDWTALLSWIVRRDWQEDDAWFCSELTEAFVNLWARPRFRERVSRITPRHQDMVI